MMFSTKAEYGVRVMAHLARREDDEAGERGEPAPISLAAIAEAEGLPLAYLEHLVARLRRADLVESRRGARGGYSLTRAAASITMAEVVEALEGEIAPIECITAGADGSLVCVREGEPGHEPCPTKLLWTRVQGSIVRTLTDMTLADLARPAAAPRREDARRSRAGHERVNGEPPRRDARLDAAPNRDRRDAARSTRDATPEAARNHERPDAQRQHRSARLDASRR